MKFLARYSSVLHDWRQWLSLVVLSLLLMPLLLWLHVPAALLLGPLLAAVILSLYGARLRVSQSYFSFAQAMIGVMVASSMNLSTLVEIADDWPIFLTVILLVIAVSCGLGWLLAHYRVLPGSSAIWGTSPGGASVMVLMAQAHGADMRLVALMQYLRVVMVVLAASVVCSIFTIAPIDNSHGLTYWFPENNSALVALTLLVAIIGAWLGRCLRLPAGAMLMPLIIAMVINGSGVTHLQLPPWLLALSYTALGWVIGLQFNRETVRASWQMLPRLLMAIGCMILLCGGLAVLLSALFGIDPLTAYLATSPGGLDSIAIIAASSTSVNLSFVMALQMSRLLLVILLGPLLARGLAAHMAR